MFKNNVNFLAYRFLSLVFFMSCFLGTIACKDNKPFAFNVAGIQVQPQDVAKVVSETVQEAAKAGQLREDHINREMKKLYEARLALGQKFDKKKIGQAEYEQATKNIDQVLARLQIEHDKLVERGDRVGDNIQKIIVQGAGTFLEMQKDENARKTTIATAAAQAAAQQAEKNKGDFDRLKLKMQQFSQMMSDPKFYTKMGVFLSLTTVGITGGYYGLKFLYRYGESLIGKPTLVIESSRTSWLGAWYDYLFGTAVDESIFDDAIFSHDLKHNIVQFALQTKRIHDLKMAGKVLDIPYRNLLLYGPPGTGKTMVAKKIAQLSGMQYAIIPAANVRDIEQVNQIFNWAEHTPEGMVIFLDEIDAIGKKRDKLDHYDSKILDTILARTEQAKHKCVLVFATNHPGLLDDALLSRIAEQFAVPVPDAQVREFMVRHYWKKHIESDPEVRVAHDVDAECTQRVSTKLKGFSGRQIADLFVALRIKALVDGAGVLSKDLCMQVVADKVAQHKAIEQGFGMVRHQEELAR
ncbi:MAG: AAA family ATPase [bacterium]